MNAVEVEGLGVELGGEEVLRDVSFDVGEGVLVGLVGPNGAGKTTLIRCINGVLEPDDGAVMVGGDDVEAMSSKRVSRRVATVPQNTDVSFEFSVKEVVRMGRYAHIPRFGTETDDDAEAVERAMERTETAEFAERSIHEVSGGERQRILIARALAQETPVVLLDEPTASLDIRHQIRTFELVEDLVEEGKTVVAAIHDLNLAARYCDELILLNDGSLVSKGRPEDVLDADSLRETFGTRAVIGRSATGSVDVTAVPEPDDTDATVHVVGGNGSASRHLYELWRDGYDVSVGGLNEGDADLETARGLGIDAVVEDAFSAVCDGTRDAVVERVRDADVTVVCDLPFGAVNRANLEAVREAERVVLVEERDFEERNHAGEEVRRVYDELRGREGSVCVNDDEVLDAVERCVDV